MKQKYEHAVLEVDGERFSMTITNMVLPPIRWRHASKGWRRIRRRASKGWRLHQRRAKAESRKQNVLEPRQ
jgi:hypothetical protein